jgi:Ca2+-binding RTX toxin-like protein
MAPDGADADSLPDIADQDAVYNIEDIVGTANADTITGNGSINILSGADGADDIDGADGDDIIYGETNVNYFTNTSSTGAINIGDVVEVGATYYRAKIAQTTVTFTSETYTNTTNWEVYTNYGADKLNGGLGKDTIYGGLGNDIIKGGSGDDELNGQIGDDTLYGEEGNDIIRGGSGSDTVSYAGTVIGVTVDFVQNKGFVGVETDTYDSVENAVGSSFDDVFVSDLNVSNKIDGGSEVGNYEINGDSISYADVTVTATQETLDKVVVNLSGTQTDGYYAAQIYQDGSVVTTDYLKNMENITGSKGNDTITADDDTNTLLGGDGDDILDGKAGSDSINGGDGTDTISYEGRATAVTVNFNTLRATTSTETDIFEEIENAIGGTLNDTFIMNQDYIDNVIDGKGTSSSGGTNTVSYETYTNGVKVNLSTTSAQTVLAASTGTDHDIDTLLNIQNITGSGKDDTFMGSSVSNIISGGIGNDIFIAGTDTDNNGTKDAWGTGDGADEFDGGDDEDWADYSVIADDSIDSTFGIKVTLAGAINASVTVNAQSGVDKLKNVEHIIGTADKDSIVGDAQANSLVGNAGNDILKGAGGADILIGNDGDDTLTGGVGNDVIYGGNVTVVSGEITAHADSGNDTVDYSRFR